jgi:hypothetical protein
MGTSNTIRYFSDPILNQKNLVDTTCSKIHRNAIIVLQRGTHCCGADGVIGRYAAWCRPLYGVYSCLKRNSRGFVLQSRRRCQALCSHETASGLLLKLYTLRYLCAQNLQVVFSVTWHILNFTAQITHFGQLMLDNYIYCALYWKLLYHEYVARDLFLKGDLPASIPGCRRDASHTGKYYATCPTVHQAILVYKWRKSKVSSNLPLTAMQCESKITSTSPLRYYNALPV